MRWWIAAGIGASLMLFLVHQWLGARLIREETVAGLISPQGADMAGVAWIVSFLVLRLTLFLGLPSAMVGAGTAYALWRWPAPQRRTSD